jgi:hypothetical protein
MAHWLIDLASQHGQFFFKLEDALLERLHYKAGISAPGYSAHVFCFACVQRRGAL